MNGSRALNAAVVAADRAGLQVWLHAIGDRGVRMALDAHEAVARANGARDRRGRIEHIETIDPADYPRFASLGVIASMQPLHANPDQNNADVWSRNLGKDRAALGFGWGNIERAGARLVFGSDWPVVTSDVRRASSAGQRRTREGKPEGGWIPTGGSWTPLSIADRAAYARSRGGAGSLRPGKTGRRSVGVSGLMPIRRRHPVGRVLPRASTGGLSSARKDFAPGVP